MRSDPLVPAFYYYKFADAISAPYTSLSAYSSGVIDSSGHIIKPESSIDPFEYFVIKLKKIFEQLPYGTTKASLASYIPALQMFSEEAQDYGMESEHFNYFVEGMVASESNGELSYLELVEEMGSANLGGPATSNNTGGVSGYDPPMQKGVMKRKSILGFENSCEMFDVCPDDYEGIKSAKAWRHVPESESKSYLQRYQRRNGKGKMAIRNSDTGEVHFISMKPQSFMEEYGLEGLDILNEDYDDFDDDDFLIMETKKQVLPRTHDDDHEQLQTHIKSLVDLHGNTKNRAHKSEYEARLINHIKNYHSVKNNPEHLKTYVDTTHSTILSPASATSKDTHAIHFDNNGGMNLKAIDVKDISSGDAYVSSEISKNEFMEIPKVKDLLDTSTSHESEELRVRKGEHVSSAIKKAMDDHYQNNPTKEAGFHPKESSFMVKRNDGRYYMAGPEVLGSTSERKIRLSETGHQRRSRKAGGENPHPNLRRVTARKATRILDPLKGNPKLSPVSISGDEYGSVSHSMDSDTLAQLNSILKPHL
jgi:hypothetical protein